MKPPRVISHKGYFYVTYYLPGHTHAIKEPVGIKLDIEKGTGDWWKKSKHRAKIKIVLEDALARKLRYKQGHEFERPLYRTKIIRKSLLEVSQEYSREREILKGYAEAPSTRTVRENAVKLLLRFDNKLPLQITQAHALAFRDWVLHDLEYEPSTFKEYLVKLKTLYTFALKKKWVRINPFEGMGVEVKQKEVRHISHADQILVYDAIYEKGPALFWQVMFNRLSGFRVSEVCNLEHDNIKGDKIVMGKVKKRGRTVTYPVTKLLEICIRNAGLNGKYIFAERSRHGVTQPIEYTCKQLGIPIFGAHQLKKDYAEEIGPFVRKDPYLKNLMLHHAPKWMTSVADTHYIGDDLKLMKKTAEKAQVFWYKYLQEKGKNRVTDFANDDFTLE